MSPWDRAGARSRRGTARLYRVGALEVIFTVAPPWLPYLLIGPIALVCVANAVMSLPAITFALLLAMGALLWSLVEYAMHRFLFHAKAESEPARVILLLVHGHHHVWPDDPRRVAATPIQFVSLSLLLYGLFSLALSPPARDAAFSGAMFAYLGYEAMHYAVHHGRARTGIVGAVRRHHMLHHHEDPRARWGISSPLWDVVFRTMGEKR